MSNIIASIQFKRGLKATLDATLVGAKKPLKGEPVWETDTNKLKIGDGINNYADLPYLTGNEPIESSIIVKGYYYDGAFYEDDEHTTPLTIHPSKLYIDIPTLEVYYYSPITNYTKLISNAVAGSGVAGLTKLYAGVGNNADGAMTQQATTDELNRKVEVSIDEMDTECMVFSTNQN